MNRRILIIIPTFLIVIYSIYSCGAGDPAPISQKKIYISQDSLIRKGEYLVTVIGCSDCHSPKIMGPNGPQIDSTRLLSGYPSSRPVPTFPFEVIKNNMIVVNLDGTAAMGPWGTTFAANITSDVTGIGSWTEEQFKNAFSHGKYKGLEGSRPLMPLMPWQNYSNIKDEDSKAIFAYLKSTRPVDNVVPAFIPAENK